MVAFALLVATVQATLSQSECNDARLVCERPLPSTSTLETLIRSEPLAWRVERDTLLVVARDSAPAMLCCEVQRDLRPVEGDLQAIALRIPDIATAIIDIKIMANGRVRGEGTYRGPDAMASPARARGDERRFASHEIASRHLGESRYVRVYTPPNMRADARLPVLYFGDGLNPQYIELAEALWQSGIVRPFILVGIDSSMRRDTPGCTSRCDGRSLEYLAEIEGLPTGLSRFDAHARFVIDEVMPLIEAHYPASQTAADRLVGGYSSGGSWAATMASRHPDVFGGTIAMGIGWPFVAADASRLSSGRIFIGAGKLDGRFYENSQLAVRNATRAGAQVRFLTPNGGHGEETWAILFADALRWHFPAER